MRTKHSLRQAQGKSPRYHLNSLIAQRSRQLTCSSVYAITGNPVPFYFHSDFFGIYIRRLRRCFPAETSTLHLLLYQATTHVLLLNGGDYTRRGEESQEKLPVSGTNPGDGQVLYLSEEILELEASQPIYLPRPPSVDGAALLAEERYCGREPHENQHYC